MVEKAGGVYIEDQLAVAESALFDTACGDDSIGLHLFKLFQIAAVRLLEVNIQMGAFRDYILVDIPMDTVASCHRTPFSPHEGRLRCG